MNNGKEDSAVLHAILEAAVDAIVVSDQLGKILRANPAAAALFQYDLAEMIGQSVNMLMPRAMADMHDRFMSHHIETGEKHIIGIGREVEGQRKDRSVFPLHLSVGHSEVGGQPIFIAILHDLTLRKATEDALARSQRLDAIGQMTGGIAHDFNNLLTVIVGNLELLFASKSHLKPEKTDLRQVCLEALALVRRTMGPTFDIKTDFPDNLDSVMVDLVHLKSALMNLVLNARDAMAEGGKLLLSLQNVTIDDTYMAQETDIEAGDYVRLSVSDNGGGMSPEAQRRAFEPFFTTKPKSDGAGLGLAMVYGFVRQSGGHVTLYSELGLGTSFGLYFPALAREAGHGAAEIPSTLPRGNRQSILIVEDNPKVRKLSIERIRDLGYSIIAANSGDQAYQILKDGAKVDLVFSDVVMPGTLNGYDLAAKIALEFPKLKVLLTSGYASDVIKTGLAHEKRHKILHKPYRQSELAERLQALFAARSAD